MSIWRGTLLFPAHTAPSLLMQHGSDVMAVSHALGVPRTMSIAFMASSSQTMRKPQPSEEEQDSSTHFKFRNQGKSDKILETVLRMDGLLRSIHENLVRASLSLISAVSMMN